MMSARVADLLHTDKYVEAGQVAADFIGGEAGLTILVESRDKATEILTLLVHWLLENNGYEETAEILWSPTLFTVKPESARRVWNAFEESDLILLMGASSMSKSYSMGVRLMLEFIRDPEYTTVRVVGPSEKHLEENLFSHLVTLHQKSTIPLPGQIGKLFIGLDTRSRKGSISGVVIPIGKRAAVRLQGSKRINRKTPHPIFGPLSRQYIFLDEVAGIPPGVWSDIDNLIAASQGDSGQKIIGAFNPKNIHDEVGLRTEPPGGWPSFDPDTDLDWTSTRGWRVVRLDAARCENVVSGEKIYSGLQTKFGFEQAIRNAGGLDSAGYWSMCRGCFPPSGVPMSIIPAGMLADIRCEVLWYERPVPLGAVDMALLGGDVAVFTKGSFGMASGLKYLPSLDHPEGRVVNFKNNKGQAFPRNILHVEAVIKMPKGETRAMTDEVKRIARTFSIRPDWLCIDRTGNGQGVYDLLLFEFGEVIGVNYSESTTGRRIMVEDHAPADELYDRIHTELWFAARKFIEFNYCVFAPGVPTDDLFPQLTQRRYRMSGKKARVEKKEDYQSRANGKSPDEADSFTLLVHCARMASDFTPGMMPENSSDHRVGFDYDDERDGVRVDVTNRFDSLED